MASVWFLRWYEVLEMIEQGFGTADEIMAVKPWTRLLIENAVNRLIKRGDVTGKGTPRNPWRPRVIRASGPNPLTVLQSDEPLVRDGELAAAVLLREQRRRMLQAVWEAIGRPDEFDVLTASGPQHIAWQGGELLTRFPYQSGDRVCVDITPLAKTGADYIATPTPLGVEVLDVRWRRL